MRKIVAGLFISLDGVVESPDQWGFQFMTPEMSQVISNGISQADTVLLGRKTYLEFSRLWPGQGSEVPMADFLNKSRKFVVSSTLEKLDWQPAQLINGDLVRELSALKQQPGSNIQVPGSPSLVRFLLQHGLLDMLSLSICPVVVSAGMRLFDGDGSKARLGLVHGSILDNGVIGATYQALPREGRADQPPINFPQAAVSNA